MTAEAAKLSECVYMLLYLTLQTWARDEGSAALGLELMKAMDLEVTVLLVHETDEGAGGVKFETFFRTTPTSLIDDGLFERIAIEWHRREPYQSVSLRLIARELGTRLPPHCHAHCA